MLLVAIFVAVGFLTAQWSGADFLSIVEPIILSLIASLSLVTTWQVFARRGVFTMLGLMLLVFLVLWMFPGVVAHFLPEQSSVALGYPLVERVPFTLLFLFPAVVWGGVAWSLRFPVDSPWAKAFLGATLSTVLGLAFVQDVSDVLPTLPGTILFFALCFIATIGIFVGCSLATLYRRREEPRLLVSALCFTCYLVGGLVMQGSWVGLLLALAGGTLLFEATGSLRKKRL